MRYKRGSVSRASVSTVIARTTPSIALTEAAEISQESTPLPNFHGNNAESGQVNQRKRSQNWEEDESDDEEREKRKNIMDIEERRRQLEADAWAIDVEAKRVRCRGCTRWIKLDQRSLYYRGLWDKHRGLCRGIKRLKGEYIPKRTRRSKGTVSVAKRRKGMIPVHASASGRATSDDTTETETGARSESVETFTQSGTSTARRVADHSSATENKRPRRIRKSHAFPDSVVTHTQAFPSREATNNRRSYSSSADCGTPASDDYGSESATALNQTVSRSAERELTYPIFCAHRDPWSSWHGKGGRPTPGVMARGRSVTYSCDEESHATEGYDDEDRDAGVFAPDIPGKCPSIPCHHRFRFSTHHELDTYFDGATILSLARDFPSIKPSGTVHAVRCLASSGKGMHAE